MNLLQFKFFVQSAQHYPLLCEMMIIDLKPELKTVLGRIFSRIGLLYINKVNKIT